MDVTRIIAVSLTAALLLLIIVMETSRLPVTNSRICQLEKLTKDVSYGKEFIIHGKWKPGKKLDHDYCEFFINTTKCCKKEQNLHFEFYDKKLNEVDAVQDFKRILNNKKLLLIGDSIMLEFFNGLVALIRGRSEFVGIPETKNNNNFLRRLISTRKNRTLTFLAAQTITLEGEKPFTKKGIYAPLEEDIVRKEISNHDVIFINQGLHYSAITLLFETASHFHGIGQMLHGNSALLAVITNLYLVHTYRHRHRHGYSDG